MFLSGEIIILIPIRENHISVISNRISRRSNTSYHTIELLTVYHINDIHKH